jgi:hypothetical protein
MTSPFRTIQLGFWSCVLALPATGQGETGGGEPGALAAAVDAWLASDLVDEKRLQATVQAVLADPALGLPWLGVRLRQALAAPTERASKGITALSTHVVLGFLQRTRESGITWRGQYAPLRELQPFAGDLLVQLLLQTPDWFPDTHRGHLVPALRDLFPTAPSMPVLLGVVAIVENTEIEPASLRLDLSCLLWQWGRKEPAQQQLAQLRAAAAEGDADDRLFALRQLAHLQYRLGDYVRAAATHASMRVLADSARIRLSPTDWYWAACCSALTGDREGGIAALRRCAALQASAEVDASLKLPRKLFEHDPEIALLRADPRFAELLAQAFPSKPARDKER